MERLSNKESESKAKHTVPVGRWGHKKEIADATVYLFSDAGNFVNGAVQVVDGGSWGLGPLASLNLKYPEHLEDRWLGNLRKVVRSRNIYEFRYSVLVC